MSKAHSRRSISDAGNSTMSTIASPFKLPTDEEVFITREAERMAKDEEKERARHMRIWEKQTGCTGNKLFRPKDEDIPASPFIGDLSPAKLFERPQHRNLISAALSIVNNRKNVKQNIFLRECTKDYVDQKKEMFLVEMSNRTLQKEIVKITARCKAKQAALDKSEAFLERDHKGFNDHMERNTKATQDAQDRALKESQAKKDVEANIKIKESEKSTISAEITRNMDMLDGLNKFKVFLDELTPPEWMAQLDEEKKKQYEIIKQTWVTKMLDGDIDESGTFDDNASMGSSRQVTRELTREPTRGMSPGKAHRLRKADLERKFDDLIASGQEHLEYVEEMYFTDPSQITSLLKDLEDDNLFLIELQQDLERDLEQITNDFTNVKRHGNARTDVLMGNKAHLDERMERLDITISNAVNDSEEHNDDQTNECLDIIEQQLAGFYKVIIEDDATANPIDMLRTVEQATRGQLEILKAVNAVDPLLIKQAGKDKETERRKAKIEQQQEAERVLNDQRRIAAQARADAEIPKQTGRKLMKKMLIEKKLKKVKVVVVEKTEEEEIKEFIEEMS